MVVRQVYADGTAQVSHVRRSACSGDCHKCSGCGAAQETVTVTARNPIGAKAGDVVTVSSASAPVLKAAAVLYTIPVVLFFLCYLIGALAWQHGALPGGLGFALGIGLAVVYDRRVMGKQDPCYTITAFVGNALLNPREKGDNDID